MEEFPTDFQYERIAQAIRYIARHYRRQPDLDEVAEQVHLSKFHFQRLFQQWAGVSPKQFLQMTTVEHAKRLLDEGRSTLDAAYEVGLSGNGRLHELFVKIEACTPGEFKQRGKELEIAYDVIETPFGAALVAETALGVCSLSFAGAAEDPLAALRALLPEARLVRRLGPHGRRVLDYFSTWEPPGERIVLDLRGTPFQLSVWRALLRIPPAQYQSYGSVARMIGRPAAARAVGTAIGHNPVAYLIPCHRVILESGESGQYRWGRERKIAIQGFEQARFAGGQSPAARAVFASS
jgi:AraC family transcriptional regulator of adaptative response/methylated-DNA-[protein]-cysteine methyltransferase